MRHKRINYETLAPYCLCGILLGSAACPSIDVADGGDPCATNAGCGENEQDAGLSGQDAGLTDGGNILDAGGYDGGFGSDAGAVPDSGLVLADGGDTDDAGPSDAGQIDGGHTDSGQIDGGLPSADSGISASCPSCWRSILYPDDWVPGYTDVSGRLLHDFSYAGYRNGTESIPPEVSVTLFSVLDYGADNTGTVDCTNDVQDAINAAGEAGGGVVYFPGGEYRFDDLLSITTSNLVLRGEGPSETRLFFTRHNAMTGLAHIQFRGQVQDSGEVLLAEDGESASHQVAVENAEGFAVGDEVRIGWVITDEFIAEHNMSDTWEVANGQWRNFFRREITEIDQSDSPHTITVDVPLRYRAKTRDAASIRHAEGYLKSCGIESMSLSNAVSYDNAWANDRVHVIEMKDVKDCWIWNVESYATTKGGGDGIYHLQSGGIKILGSKRVTIDDTVMENAQNRGGGGNGYLFEISQSNEILIRDAIARNGRHNFVQNWDFGTTGCVFLRTHSEGGRALIGSLDPGGIISPVGYSEFHHSLAMANLIDDSYASDGWSGVNRNGWSTGAGLTVTETVFWRLKGGGALYSFQAGMGYVIGVDDMSVFTDLDHTDLSDPLGIRPEGSEPADFVEGTGLGVVLEPASLYEDQLNRRLQ